MRSRPVSSGSTARPGRGTDHDGFWVSYRGGPLCYDRIYDVVRERLHTRFGKLMAPHDFRRAAATFLAAEAPELVGLIPGVLQHASPEVGERHYNLARSVTASRRQVGVISDLRKRLRLRAGFHWE